MKLLFDQNLSFKLCGQLADLFPGSNQVLPLGLDKADDSAIWQFCKANDFIIVTQDADFADMAALYGPPPKIIWLRCGNQPTTFVAKLLRHHAKSIFEFAADKESACWEIY